MKLISLVLENIKSYKHEEITFRNGINCILGLNGSGKSTIIESIGAALFNYSPKDLNKMLRYNEKKGNIILKFEGNDERVYIVNRTIRNSGSGSIKLIDFENNEVLYDTTSDIYKFISKLLDLPQSKSLPKMFEEIIAVPQGQFVNAFILSPAKRKENFDKLFDLDIYKSLSDKIKKIQDKIRMERINLVEQDIANISGQLVNYEKVIEEHKNVENSIVDSKKYQESLVIEFEKAKENFEYYSKLVFDIDMNKQKMEAIKENIQTISSLISENNKNVVSSKNASEIVRKNELSYNRYLQNLQEITKLEKEYDQFLSYSEKKKEFESKQSLLEERKGSVETQSMIKKLELGRVKQNIIEFNQNITKYQNDLTKHLMKKALKEKENKERDSIYFELEKEVKRNSDLLVGYQTIAPKNKELFDISKMILEKEKIENMLIDNDEVSKKINSLLVKRSLLYSEIDNIKKNEDAAISGICPLLNQKCQNVGESDLLCKLKDVIKIKTEELDKLSKEIEDNEAKIIKNKELEKKYQEICFDIHRFEEENKRIIDARNLLFSSFDALILEEDKSDVLKCLNIINEYITNKEKEKDALAKQIEEEKLKSFEVAQDINTCNFHIMTNKNNVEEKEREANRLNKLIEELKATVNSITEEIKLNSDNINQINNLLELVKNSEATIKALKISQEKLLPCYNDYNLNIQKAEELEKYLSFDKKYHVSLDEKEKELEDIQKRINHLNKNYSKEKHDSVTNQYEKLRSDIGAINQSINEKEIQKEKLQKEISNMNLLMKEKEKKNLQLDKIKSVINFLQTTRDVIVVLPKELSKQYREYISSFATVLYRKISSENVQIEILEDYEVKIINQNALLEEKTMLQLSGGEQMSVAIAIRLAMLKKIVGLDIYFMDEPTINLDEERRRQVSEVVKDISLQLRQLYVISHDDTFDNITDNVINIIKQNNESRVEE